MNELKPLFVWQKLTGRLIFESQPHKVEWPDLREETRALFNASAETLNRQLSLCSKCGERTVLSTLGICEECHTRYLELGRLAEHELLLQQTFPSQFSSLQAFEEWREQNG